MATSLSKKVVRETGISDDTGRPIIIELVAGGKDIRFRPKGTRSWYELPMNHAYNVAKSFNRKRSNQPAATKEDPDVPEIFSDEPEGKEEENNEEGSDTD